MNTVKAYWQDYKTKNIPADTCPTIQALMQHAFYAGGAAHHDLEMSAVEGLCEKHAAQQLANISQEIASFFEKEPLFKGFDPAHGKDQTFVIKLDASHVLTGVQIKDMLDSMLGPLNPKATEDFHVTAFDSGFAAAEADRPRSDNPYPEGSADFQSWLAGHQFSTALPF